MQPDLAVGLAQSFLRAGMALSLDRGQFALRINGRAVEDRMRIVEMVDYQVCARRVRWIQSDTEMFLRDNREDSDFCAFMSVWFYEEQKHSLVLIEYLRRFRPDLVPSEQELHAVRFDFDPAPSLETLMLRFCGEIRLNHWYRRAAQWHTEPVIMKIYGLISRDEARHGGAYLRYMKKAIDLSGDAARTAFAKVGLLMASSGRYRKQLSAPAAA